MPRGQVVLKLGADVAVLDGLQIDGAAVVLDAGGRTNPSSVRLQGPRCSKKEKRAGWYHPWRNRVLTAHSECVNEDVVGMAHETEIGG
jgi:hypothetical protein